MRRLFGLLILTFGIIACGGEEPAPAEPADSSTPTETAETAESATPPDSEIETGLNVVGGTKMGKVLPEEWRQIEVLTNQFYAGELQEVHARFSPDMKNEWTFETLRDFRDRTLTLYGEELEVVAANREEKQGYRAFKRAVRFSAHDGLVEIAWVLDSEDRVAGLFVTPEKTN